MDNPINPIMFVTYDQSVPVDLDELVKEKEDRKVDLRIERTIHLDISYSKFKTQAPTLLSFGSPECKKSSLLNDVFGTDFEVMQKGAAGLYHDSVDALFHCKDMPIGYNILDF